MDVDGRSQASFGSWVVWAGEVCAFITRSWYSDPLVRGRQTGAADSQRRGRGHRIPDESTFLVFSFWLSSRFLVFNFLFSRTTFCSLYFPINAAAVHLDTAVESHTMACRLLSELLIHKQFMFPHTRTNGDAQPQPPSLLDLLSYLQTLYSFPPSGNSFHVNTTSICRAALSLHTSIAGLFISVTFRENKWCLYPSCLTA